MAASQEKIWHLLRMVKGDDARTVREWIEDYHSHEGIGTMTDIEECVANGYVTIGEDKIVRLSAEGEDWLAKQADGIR